MLGRVDLEVHHAAMHVPSLLVSDLRGWVNSSLLRLTDPLWMGIPRLQVTGHKDSIYGNRTGLPEYTPSS